MSKKSLGCVGSGAPAPRDAAVPAEDALTETYFRWSPEIASFYGVPGPVAGQGYAARLHPRSPDHEKAKRAEFRELLNRLEAASEASRTETERATQLSGPQGEAPKLLASQHKVESAQDAEDYRARLDACGAAVDQVIAKVAHDRALGVVPPNFIIERANDMRCPHGRIRQARLGGTTM